MRNQKKRGDRGLRVEDQNYIYIAGERIQIAEESSRSVRALAEALAIHQSEQRDTPEEVGQFSIFYVSFTSEVHHVARNNFKMRRFVLLFISINLVLAAIGRHHRDGGFLNHVQLVHEFRCSAPQPRAVPLSELLTVGPSPDEVFYPASTVLTRCDGAGCCSDPKQICAPIETRNVSLVFMVKHTIDRQRDRHHEVIHALEHTKCGCVDKRMINFD